MTTRILHTSDWHLGVGINSQRCEDEQRRFLDWLAGEIAERAIDVLIVAGDVFHYATPSNTARAMYYDFLVDCSAVATLDQVVVVGGNHDSPTGLDAPRELLGSLDVHVVGGLPYDEAVRLERCLVPIGEGPQLVVAAVPYARRAQLGVGLDDEQGRSVQSRYR
ncbi:MAG: exonuclease SbcCD subunit D, partial [Bradymonadaceae bacterium]